MILKNALHASHEIVKKVIVEGDRVVDATAGNGNDTLFLASLVGNIGRVYAFDIQEKALENTNAKLKENHMEQRVQLINDGHQNMSKYVPHGVKVVMFNLGYLPGGDHSISTKAENTIVAIETSLNLLQIGGIIMMVVYYGGDSGFDEKDAIIEYIKSLDYKKYSVLMMDYINWRNCPPIAVCIEKIA